VTTFLHIHGAWHGPWAWDRIVPLLHQAGALTVTPDLSSSAGSGLHDHAGTVVSAIDRVGAADDVVLVGHSYAGLVVREAANLRPDGVKHIVLIDAWAGTDGDSLLSLAPPSFGDAIRAAAAASPDGRLIPPPPPAAFGIVDDDAKRDAAWLEARLRPQSLRSFTEATQLTEAVEQIPGTGVYCTPQTYPFDRFAATLGYRTVALSGPHDVMLARPDAVARILLGAAHS
jgi:pimeloyl-ACP methyl ester carboxylesterase